MPNCKVPGVSPFCDSIQALYRSFPPFDEAGAEGVAIEFPNTVPFRLPQGIEGLDRIVDRNNNNKVGAAALDRPTNARRKAVSVLTCHKFMPR